MTSTNLKNVFLLDLMIILHMILQSQSKMITSFAIFGVYVVLWKLDAELFVWTSNSQQPY